MTRRVLPLIALAAVVFAVVLLTTGGSSGHRVTVTVPDATNVVAGQAIRVAGREVGRVVSVKPVEGGHAVRLRLEVSKQAWPLPRGTTMTVRWGGTVSFDNRYIALALGPAGGPPILRGDVFPASSFATPAELDQLLTTFTAPVRRDLRSFIDRAGVTLRTAKPNLARALDAAPPALTEASAVLRDIDSNEAAFNTLLRSTDSVVGAVHTADPGIANLVTGAATTFGAVASRAQQVQATLAAAPGTFAHVKSTLARADGTLAAAADVTDRIAPGVAEVRKIAAPLNSALHTVVSVGPTARATLSTAHRAAPDLNSLLQRLQTIMPKAGSIGTQAVNELECIRPYTPDIVGFITDWGDFISPVDGKDHYFRAQVQSLVPAPSNANIENSGQMAKLFPWVQYAYPSPPGFASGKPWFQPQCGAGPETIDPQKDPEARTYNPLEQIPPLSVRTTKGQG